MQGHGARTCANRHVLDCLNPPKVVALTNERPFWFHLPRWPPRKLRGRGAGGGGAVYRLQSTLS